MNTHRPKRRIAALLVIAAALAPIPAWADQIACWRTVTAVFSNNTGTLVVRSTSLNPTTSISWTLCSLDTEAPGAAITPTVCQIFFMQLTVGLTTEIPVVFAFDTDVLDATPGLWDGQTCESIQNWGAVSRALLSVQVRKAGT